MSINNLSLEEQLDAVKKNGHALQFIKNPSEEVQIAAVKKNGHALQFIKNPSEEVQIAAVRKDGFSIQYIDNPSEEVQLAAVRQNGYVIRHITNPSEEVRLEAVKNMLLDNFHYYISIESRDKIHIGCMTKSLKEWLLFEDYEENGIHEIEAVKVKQLLKEYFK